jgi:CRP-like cAMP-binding protein
VEAMGDLANMEKLFEQYINENRTEDAVKVLFELIHQHALCKHFAKAEELRDRLFEVDPSALNEIIKAAEIIDEEKAKSFNQDHLAIWSDLYSALSTHESNTLHFAMMERTYNADEIVFKQGKTDTNLYFIDSGRLKLVYSHGRDEFLIKKIGPGEIVGEDTFFSNTAFSTSSLITISKVTLHLLEAAASLSWENEYPLIISLLKDYCGRFRAVHSKKNLNRRLNKRVDSSGTGTIQVLDASGSPIAKPVRVSIADISVGGVSFWLQALNQETARRLLGKGLYIKISISVRELKENSVTKKGLVVGVRYYGFGDRSVHIKFDKMLPKELIDAIERANAK